MTSQTIDRPKSDIIDVADFDAISAWAAWLEVEDQMLVRLVGIVGSSAGQVEHILGRKTSARW